jgi:hypothetical protein
MDGLPAYNLLYIPGYFTPAEQLRQPVYDYENRFLLPIYDL